MKKVHFTSVENYLLSALALFGFVVPNGVFAYFALTDSSVLRGALTNPISLVFIFEAFFLMTLFAWLLKSARIEKPSGFTFIAMSLIGSMVFSVPVALYLLSREQVTKEESFSRKK